MVEKKKNYKQLISQLSHIQNRKIFDILRNYILSNDLTCVIGVAAG